MNESSVEPYLSPGEKLLWSGAPKKKFRFERKHWPILFVVLPIIATFVFIPIIGVFGGNETGQAGAGTTQTQSAAQPSAMQGSAGSGTAEPEKPIPLAMRILIALSFGVFAGGMVAWILYSMGFTFGGTAFLEGETLYAITHQRLIVIAGRKQKTIRSIHLGTATDLRMKEWPDGLGSISFGPEPIWPQATPLRNSNTVLENIAEPRKVFQIIIDARKSA